MIDQNVNNDKNLNGNELVEDKGMDSKDRTELSILIIFVFCGSLFIFQLISYIFNIDFLAPFLGFNFIIIPICIAITFIILYIFNKTRLMVKVLDFIDRLINYVKKYRYIYRFLKLIYKHPLISAASVGVIWGIIKSLVSVV